MLSIFKIRSEVTVVPIFGGLGNQLFQYAFALTRLRSPYSRVFLLDSSGRVRVSRKFELTGLISASEQKIFGIELPIFSIILGKFVHWYLKLPVGRQQFFEKFGIYKEGFLPLSRSTVCIGQFQNYDFTDEISKILLVNYSEFLKSYITKERFVRKYKYIVIHVRRGDYERESHGYLSQNYYLTILQKINFEGCQIVVHTDDVTSAEALGRQVKISEIIGPEEADPWDVIIDMAGAELVICANSTLSWWGGWFCVQKGGRAYIPKPWFKTLNYGSKLDYPGFSNVSPIWE